MGEQNGGFKVRCFQEWGSDRIRGVGELKFCFRNSHEENATYRINFSALVLMVGSAVGTIPCLSCLYGYNHAVKLRIYYTTITDRQTDRQMDRQNEIDRR